MKVCGECHGKGHYIIKNAYDPSYSLTVKCEYCKPTKPSKSPS